MHIIKTISVFFSIFCIIRSENVPDRDSVSLYIIDSEKKFERSSMMQDSFLHIHLNTTTLLICAEKEKTQTIALKPGYRVYISDIKSGASQKVVADLLFANGDYASAFQAYKKALTLKHSLGESQKNYYKLLILYSKPELVIAQLEKDIQSGIDGPNTRNYLAQAYIKKKEYAKALQIFDQLLKTDETNVEALIGKGEVCFYMQQYEDARSVLNAAVRIKPDAINAYALLGKVSMHMHDTNTVIDQLLHFFKNGGKDQDAAFILGNVLYSQKSYEESLNYLTMVTNKNSATDSYNYMLGDAYFQINEMKKSIPYFQKVFKLTKSGNSKKAALLKLTEAYLNLDQHKSAAYWFGLYNRIQNTSNYQSAYFKAFFTEKQNSARAVALYTSNISKYKDDYRNYMRLALLYSKNLKYHSLIPPLMDELNVFAESNKYLWLEIAQLNTNLKRADQAIEAYKNYMQAFPEIKQLAYTIGVLLLKKKNQEALTYLEKAFQSDPQNTKIQESLGEGYVLFERYDDALKILEQSLAIDSLNINTSKNLVHVYLNTNQQEKAIDLLKNLLKKKRDTKLHTLYIKTLITTKRYDEAKEGIEDVLATTPDNVEILLMKVYLLKEVKLYEDALALCKEITSIDPSNASATYESGDVYRLQNKILWAEKYYKSCLKIDSKYALAYVGLAELSLVRKDTVTYRKQINKAYELDPKNELIKKKYSNLD